MSFKRGSFGGRTPAVRSDETVQDSRVIDASKFFTALNAKQRLRRRKPHISNTEYDGRLKDEYSVLKINYPRSGNISQFTYDEFGHVVSIVETVSGTIASTKQFVWCFNSRCEARDASSSVVSRYFTLGQTISGTNYFFSKDHLGSIKDVSDNAGVLQAEYSYDSTGRTIKLYGSLDSDFQYAGYYEHAQSGLCMTQTRFYNPAVSRFLSKDPIGEQGYRVAASPDLASTTFTGGNLLTSSLPLGGLQIYTFTGMSGLSSNGSLYSYVGNNPINYVDPSGLQGADAFFPWVQPWMICVLAVGFTGGVAFAAVTAITKIPAWGGVAAVAAGGAMYLYLPECRCFSRKGQGDTGGGNSTGGGDNTHNENAPARFF